MVQNERIDLLGYYLCTKRPRGKINPFFVMINVFLCRDVCISSHLAM